MREMPNLTIQRRDRDNKQLGGRIVRRVNLDCCQKDFLLWLSPTKSGKKKKILVEAIFQSSHLLKLHSFSLAGLWAVTQLVGSGY